MPQIIKTDAVVLRKKSLLDKDTVVTIFSKEYGKLRIIAKGIKKITSRRAAHVQTGNLVATELNVRGETFYLQNTTITSAFSQIKSDPEKINYLYRFLFIIDRILPEGQPEFAVYQTMLKALIYLSKADRVTLDKFSAFLQEILHDLGYGEAPGGYNDIIRKIEEIIHEKVPEHVII